jgi:outer membrane protein
MFWLGPLLMGRAQAQCDGMAGTPREAVACAARNVPGTAIEQIDPTREYSLAELIDLAERNNPKTRAAWERAKQRAERLGIARSEYFPILAGVASFADQRFISPFPEALLPRGYSMVETPTVQPEVTLQYLIFDFGKRAGQVQAAKEAALAAGADFIYSNQQVAFAVSEAYYDLETAQERTSASREILKTAQTTQDDAYARLDNGRATLPDALNAKAETAQAIFDLAAAEGQERMARVLLAEELGVEPSPDVHINASRTVAPPDTLSLPIRQLIERAITDRPDLQAQLARIKAAQEQIRIAKSAYLPSIGLSAEAAQTATWPTADNSLLGAANETTWAASLTIQWRIFDGGARKNELAIAQSEKRNAENDLRELRDHAQREVWNSYIAFETAQSQQQAAVSLMEAATESYSSSLDAYNNGVKNLIDVVTAQKQLALARLSAVNARSQVFLQAVGIEFSTGNLLRSAPPATSHRNPNGSPK